MDGKSLTPQEEKLKQLKEILPEVFAEGKIDWEKLQATLGENINFNNERYVLNWAGKSESFKVLQTPTTKTLEPVKEESENFDETENIFIEGENLEVLKVLQKSYFGKVKMIYIDPPYNTGNDSFIYPDKFSETKGEYEKRVGDKDEDGFLTKDGMFRKNSKENGQYHSNWLNMMYPRLFLAKNLLRQDGVIFVSIDDNEVHNLRLVMNEIFGEENCIGTVCWKNKYGAGAKTKGFIDVHEYILCYSKTEIQNIESILTKEQSKVYDKSRDERYESRGGFVTQPLMTNSLDDRENLQYSIEFNGEIISPRKQWVWGKKRLIEAIEKNEVVFKKKKNEEYSVRAKVYLKDINGRIRKGKPLSLLNGPFNQEGTKEVEELLGPNIFSFPKPASLINFFFGFTINEKDDLDGIYLDFFAGSSVSAHAVMDLNKEDGGKRKYICVQLPELCDPKKEAFKAGYKTIAEIAKERIRRAGKKIQEELEAEKEKKNGELDLEPTEEKNIDLGFKVLKLTESNFKQWQQTQNKDAKELEEQMRLFVDPVSESATTEKMLYELLLKSGKDLNSKVEHKQNYYCVNGNELVLMLEKATQEIIEKVISEQPQKVIALDKLFKGNDQLKTNTVLQMKDSGIEFKTI
ncbi:MAG: site-specific DNA-methyltransferase [Calditrichaeota bacterium]|nr:MAG: site-specific DNA-methyltransferase [Calditrichota bacterium]